jgi:hypothetical protein
MDMYEKQVIIDRICEIELEQLSWLEYVCNKFDVMVDEQKDIVHDRMLQLRVEKEKLLNI